MSTILTPANTPPVFPTATVGANTSLVGSPIFGPKYPLNRSIAGAPLDAARTAAVWGTWGGYLKPDISIPYNVVDSRVTPFVQVSVIESPDESDLCAVPIPENAQVEQGSDAHLLILDMATGWEYDLYHYVPATATSPATCGSLAIFPGRSQTPYRPYTWTAGDDAALPMLNHILKYDEAAEGNIPHALRFTFKQTAVDCFISPASHGGASSDVPANPPEGSRLVLPADWTSAVPLSPINQAILNCFKGPGLVIADIGDDYYMQGAPDSRWDFNDLQVLFEQMDIHLFNFIAAPVLYYDYLPQGNDPIIDSFTCVNNNDGTMTFSAAIDNAGEPPAYAYIVGLPPMSGPTLTVPFAAGTYILNANNMFGSTTASVTI